MRGRAVPGRRWWPGCLPPRWPPLKSRRYAIGQLLGLVHVIGHQQDGGAGGSKVVHDLPCALATRGVETCCRLVQKQQPGVANYAQSQVEPAFLASSRTGFYLLLSLLSPPSPRLMTSSTSGTLKGSSPRCGRQYPRTFRYGSTAISWRTSPIWPRGAYGRWCGNQGPNQAPKHTLRSRWRNPSRISRYPLSCPHHWGRVGQKSHCPQR